MTKLTIPDDDNSSFRFAFGYRDTDHHWSHLQGWFIRYARRILTVSEFAFIHQLSCYDFDDDGISSADNAELADAMQCTTRHIRRIKTGLIERGLLVITHHATYSEYDFSAIFDQVAQLVPSGWFETKKTRSPRADENVQDAKTDENVRKADENVLPRRTKMSSTSNIYQVKEESSDGSPTPPQAGTKKTDPKPKPKPKPTTPAAWERQWYMVMMGGRYMTVPVRGMPSENAHFTQGKTANSMTTAKSNGSMWVYMSSLNMLDYVVYKWRPTMNDDEIEATLKDRKLVWKGKQGNGTMLSKVSPANILHLYQNADEKGLEIYRSASWERLLASIIAEQSGTTPEDEPAPQPEQTEPPATDEPKPKRTAAEMLAHAAAYMARIAETSQNPVPYTPSEAPDDDHIPF